MGTLFYLTLLLIDISGGETICHTYPHTKSIKRLDVRLSITLRILMIIEKKLILNDTCQI